MTVLEKSDWNSAARLAEVMSVASEFIVVAGCVSLVVVVVVSVVVMLACAVAVVDFVDVVDL